jgi:PPK2 family polyphosphate:nucleotide phosphotransferase
MAQGRTKTIHAARFRVRAGAEIDLAKWPTAVPPFYKSKAEYREMLRRHIRELGALQELLYASNRYSVLVIFQGMDASGKDGAIKHVMSGINPQGCDVVSFKHPSAGELEHDFLWRTTCRLPERGRIGIFNRSYYEEVLIVRVHPRILRSEGIPDHLVEEAAVWKQRYDSILDLERHLHRNGTRIVKLFLHLSRKEQCERFLRRLERPDKHWKISMGDIEERRYWRQYMRAYQACLSGTSTPHAPWYAVPADDKRNARLIVSQILLDTLRDLKLAFPKPDAGRRQELRQVRQLLETQM